MELATNTAPVETGNTSSENQEGGIPTQDGDQGVLSSNDSSEATGLTKRAPKTDQKVPKPGKKAYKVSGRDIEIDEKDVDAYVQKGLLFEKVKDPEYAKRTQALQKKIEEMEGVTGTATQFIEALQKDPVNALMQLYQGDTAKVRSFLEPFIADQYRQEMEDEKNPANRAAREAVARAERAEQALRQREEETQKAQELKTKQELIADYQKKIITSLQKSNFPVTEKNVQRVAEWFKRGVKYGVEYSDEDIADSIKTEITQDVQFLGKEIADNADKAFKEKDDAKLIELGKYADSIFGEQILNALRYIDLARYRQKQAPLPKAAVEQPKAGEPAPKKGNYMNWDEWKDEIQKRGQAVSKGELIPKW